MEWLSELSMPTVFVMGVGVGLVVFIVLEVIAQRRGPTKEQMKRFAQMSKEDQQVVIDRDKMMRRYSAKEFERLLGE